LLEPQDYAYFVIYVTPDKKSETTLYQFRQIYTERQKCQKKRYIN